LHMRRMPSSRANSGIATVLGMLIFIGVLFTCVIPLFLYVNQVNSFYNQRVVEMSQFDQDRETENLLVYAFPVGNLTQLNVYIKNKCALEVRVVRVWVNQISYNISLILSGVSEGNLQNITISIPGNFDIWVTTERGNVFASFTNTIQIIAIGGGCYRWVQGAYNFGIPILVTQSGTFKVTVTDNVTNPSFQTVVNIKAAPNAYRLIQVPKPGIYYINVDIELWQTEIRQVDWEVPIAPQVQIPQGP